MSDQVMNQSRSDRQLQEDCAAIYEALEMTRPDAQKAIESLRWESSDTPEPPWLRSMRRSERPERNRRSESELQRSVQHQRAAAYRPEKAPIRAYGLRMASNRAS